MSTKLLPFAPYTVLLIRAWQESGRTAAPRKWRFRIQDLKGENAYGFADLGSLLDFLEREFGEEKGETIPTQEN